ncbi:MAG: transcription-repair coupling factor [Abditibacteriota bacterium]|nr:transcription-repair coupling factor [Abditibacteriota bacterium]
MSLGKILPLAGNIPSVKKILDAVGAGTKVVQAQSLTASAKPFLIAAALRKTGKGALIVTADRDMAEEIYAALPEYDIPAEKIHFLPSPSAFVFEDGRPDFATVGERLKALRALCFNEPGAVVIAPLESALCKCASAEDISSGAVTLSVGGEWDIDKLAADFARMGYAPADIVDSPGFFARRGGLIDIYPLGEDMPVRIDFFGDEIDSIRRFDGSTQRSVEKIKSVLVLPTSECAPTAEELKRVLPRLREEAESLAESLEGDHRRRCEEGVMKDIAEAEAGSFDRIDLYLPYFRSGTVFDFLPPEAMLILDEPARAKALQEQFVEDYIVKIRSRAAHGLTLPDAPDRHAAFEDAALPAAKSHQTLILAMLPRTVAEINPEVAEDFKASPSEQFAGRVDAFAEQLRTRTENGVTTIIASKRDKRIREILTEQSIYPAQLESAEKIIPGVYTAHSGLKSGFVVPSGKLAVVSDEDIFGATRVIRPRKVNRESVAISSVLDLKEGDLVVHINHGIGYYRGIHTKKLEIGGVEREYLLLEYAGGDKLYVPSEQIDRVQKYIGAGEDHPPKVHKIGGREWAKATARAKKQIEGMAKELAELYAWRQALGGYCCGPDTPWQQELESSFPFNETPDQLAVIEEIKNDMRSPRAMDRLVCGDVGYGKTEVALRTAFKMVTEGKQVALLAPTTVLAQQHYKTFTERMSAFPIRIAVMSRFQSRKELAETIEQLKYGAVDIVIGTHRILSSDVEFKDLGLLIIDEEQRFGVRHKEKLKQLRKNVDVLTLTATPIPRTLHMSLTGIRDLSIISDPPEGRMPIKTFVREDDPEIIRDAIVNELDRGGQVFFLHNRVQDIHFIGENLAKLVPYARIAIAHGQMTEAALERTMMDFYENKFDVLLCTTIIENGLDVPNANTIIIDDADKLGLAQLYQLRGRVGRSRRRGYAYLLFDRTKPLTDTAERRLETIKEFTGLGSGYRIAMRDLEIRGAGNLLGREQSGQMSEIGFELYCKLLENAISQIKGEAPPEPDLPPVDLPVDAYIPGEYMQNEAHRILFYNKIASAKKYGDVRAIQEELEDRFGDPPKPVWNMLAVLRMRIKCKENGIDNIAPALGQIRVKFAQGVRLTPQICKDIMREHRHCFCEPAKLSINLRSTRIIEEVEDMLDVLEKAFRRAKKEFGVE